VEKGELCMHTGYNNSVTEDRRKDHHVRKSLRYSLFDGTSSAAMIGFGESFFIPYALLMNATTLQIALLSSLPQALGSLIQVFSNWLIRGLGSRKRLVIYAAVFQGFMFIPITLTFFSGKFRVWQLLGLICLYWAFGMILSPAWNSWMGDLVNENRRGAYFGRRSKLTGASTFLAMLLAGIILQQSGHRGSGDAYISGFAIIFMLAFASRMTSVSFLSKKYEPTYAVSREAEFGFLDFLKQARFRNYGRFVTYLAFMNFAVFLSSPFFTPYMLNDLRMDYLTFTIVNAVAIVVKVLSIPVWGRAADRFGARRVLALTGMVMPIVPILWLFSDDYLWLIIIQAYSGFVWAGFEIATFSFVFDTTTPQKRATCIAYYNIINGAALITGATLGSALVSMNEVFASKYLLVFLLSGLLRFGASLYFLPGLREVRSVETIGYSRLFLKIIASMPTEGLIYELIPFRKRDSEDEQ
jgi:MFS family permease